MKIFSVGGINSSISVMVFLRAPQIRGIESDEVGVWLQYLKEKRDKTHFKKRASRYEHCRRMLSYARECDEQVNILTVYNLPCRGGNQAAFVICFSGFDGKDKFMEGLSELDEELSSF